MSLIYKHLLGRKFEHGKADCFALARDFYKDNWGIVLTDYARPDDWWENGMNLYMDHFYEEGFRPIDVNPRDLLPGDGFLMSVLSSLGVANHCAMYLGDGKILHHRYGRLSEEEPYSNLWRRCTVATLRHSKVVIPPSESKTLDLMDILPAGMKQILKVPNA